jgi:hypothetical protein
MEHYPRPMLTPEEQAKQRELARNINFTQFQSRGRILSKLCEENLRLLKEVNEHRLARGFDPLPGFDHV